MNLKHLVSSVKMFYILDKIAKFLLMLKNENAFDQYDQYDHHHHNHRYAVIGISKKSNKKKVCLTQIKQFYQTLIVSTKALSEQLVLSLLLQLLLKSSLLLHLSYFMYQCKNWLNITTFIDITVIVTINETLL